MSGRAKIVDIALRSLHVGLYTIVGAAIGVLSAPFLVTWIHTYDHGQGETEQLMLLGAIAGALSGALVYTMTVRRSK